MYEYHVDAFIPESGCNKSDKGWDIERCLSFAKFLNGYSQQGWKLHTAEYREVKSQAGCGPTSGAWLVCVFERTWPGERIGGT